MMEFTISGISKLLAYGDFFEANSIRRNENISSIIEAELDKYEYTRKIDSNYSKVGFIQIEHAINIDFNDNTNKII